MSDQDPVVRVLESKGRWPTANFSIRLHTEKNGGAEAPVRAWYTLEGDPGTLTDQIARYVKSHPDCSLRDLRRNVEGRNKDIRACVDRLLNAGRLVNLGSDKDFKLRVADDQEDGSDEEFSLELAS